jgi:hypothetical protein
MTISEGNVISLRTAIFTDDGVVGTLVLLPPIPDRRPDGHLQANVCWVYKRHRSIMDRMKGCYRKHRNAFILQHMRPLKVRPNPDLSFLWSESGHSVALTVDGEPMGFIPEDRFSGCSKSSKNPRVMNLWNEDLFQKIFKSQHLDSN